MVVTARRPAEQVLIDRKVYTTSRDLQSTTGTAADILNQLPSVDVDADGNVSLRGDPNVTVLIDGKPSAQFSGANQGLSLSQFPASDIDRIEIMTSPPAQYRAEGAAGVINIITRKTHRAGLSGTGQASVGDKRRYVAGLNANYKVGRLDLSGGVTLRQDAKERRVSTDRLASDPVTGGPVHSDENLDEHFRRLIPLAKIGADYQFDDRRSASLTLSHRELSGKRFFDQHDQAGAPAGPPTSSSDRHSDGYEWSVNSDAELSFAQKLWRPDESLTLGLQRSTTRERERYAYTNIYSLPVAAPSYDRLHLSLDLVKTEYSADYVLPMSHERSLKLGYDLEYDQNAFDNIGTNLASVTGAPIDNPNVTSHFRYRQRVDAAYGQYDSKLGRWTAQGGLRLEQTHVHTLEITGNLAAAQAYVRAYPSVHLERSLSDQATLSASLARRVTRPDPEALNPFTDYQDIHNLRAGNATLLPQDTYAYELGYTVSGKALSYGATAYYRLSRDSVTDVLRLLSADVVLATKANLPKSRAAGLEFNTSGKLTPKLSYNASGDLFYSEIDATALGVSGLKSTVGLNGKASLEYRPTGADTAQLSFSRTDRRLTPQGSIDAINLMNLGFRHQLSPDLSAIATVTDVLDSQRYRRLIATPALQDRYLRHQFGEIAYVGLIYTFGSSKKKLGGFEYDQ